ncbi:MAG: MFS superfamily sulfate permease-like transporter [Planctomycetota bacterium]
MPTTDSIVRVGGRRPAVLQSTEARDPRDSVHSRADPVATATTVNMKFFASLRDDLPASIVVFFVAVPLCLGIALASGAPALSGLIAGIIGGIVVGAISGSPLGVSGPAAGLAVIVLTAINELGSFETFLVAVVIGGAVQLVLGIARAGVLGYFFPSSVIRGMLSGIGIIIILKQIPHALGHDSDPEGDMAFAQDDGDNTLSALGHMMDDFSLSAIIVSLSALALLILWDTVLSKKGRFFQVIQGPIVAVVFGILFEVLTTKFKPSLALAREHLVQVPISENLHAFVSGLSSPNWSAINQPAVWITGVTIAIVASLETLLCVEATDKLDAQKRVTPTNRELVAQGAGNMLSGLIGGLPITQVIVRSSANIQSGGQSKMSAILHGCLILLFVLVLPQVLNLVPLASLAAVLLVVGYKLAKPALFKQMWDQGWEQFLPFAVTIIGIVFTDLLSGIALGMAVAIFMLLRAHYQNSHFLHIETADDASGTHKVRMVLAEEVTFLHKGALLNELKRIPDNSEVTIDASNAIHIDHDILEIVRDFEVTAERRNLTIETVGELNRPFKAQRLKRNKEEAISALGD